MAARSASDEHYVLDLCDEILGTPCVRHARKRELVPANGLKPVVIAKSEFVLKSKRIIRDDARDRGLVGVRLRLSGPS